MSPTGPAATSGVADAPPARSMVSQLDLLIGTKRRTVAALAMCSILAGFSETATLAIIAQAAATLVSRAKVIRFDLGGQPIHAQVGTLLLVGVAIAVFRGLLTWPLSTLPAQIAADVQENLRLRVLHAFGRASWDLQSREREGRLQELMTTQANQASQGALNATACITGGLVFVILMLGAVALSPAAAAVVFVIAVGMFIVLRPLRSLGIRRARMLSQAQLGYAGGVAEYNRLAEETQVFGAMDAQYGRFQELVRSVRDLYYTTQMLLKAIPNVYQSLIYIVILVGLVVLHATSAGKAGSLGAVVLLLLRASQTGQSVQASYQTLQQSLPFADRLQSAEADYRASRLLDEGQPLPEVNALAFENVSFHYNAGRPVLSDVSFSVEAGEAIGIVGPSGAGKSTLVQILLRLRRPTDGVYLVNGQPAERFSRDDWRRVVAYVPQEPRLLHATVAENIRFFRTLDDEAVERAARLARIHEDIVSWPQGYDTVIGPRADAISGGQQQRICLARALVARPSILVLDEPTSALDPKSESLIQESLTALKNELTLFTVAHRMSTLDMCTRVMVILDGRLVAFDTKEVLQEQNPYYRSASILAAGAPGGTLP